MFSVTEFLFNSANLNKLQMRQKAVTCWAFKQAATKRPTLKAPSGETILH